MPLHIVKIIKSELFFSSNILGTEIQKTLMYTSGNLFSVYTEDRL